MVILKYYFHSEYVVDFILGKGVNNQSKLVKIIINISI